MSEHKDDLRVFSDRMLSVVLALLVVGLVVVILLDIPQRGSLATFVAIAFAAKLYTRKQLRVRP